MEELYKRIDKALKKKEAMNQKGKPINQHF